ncbi:11860_t:CDS:2, partial [Ambispora gerdemannii]
KLFTTVVITQKDIHENGQILYEKLKLYFQFDGSPLLKILFESYHRKGIRFHETGNPIEERNQRVFIKQIQLELPTNGWSQYIQEYLHQLYEDIHWFCESKLSKLYVERELSSDSIIQLQGEQSLFESSSEEISNEEYQKLTNTTFGTDHPNVGHIKQNCRIMQAKQQNRNQYTNQNRLNNNYYQQNYRYTSPVYNRSPPIRRNEQNRPNQYNQRSPNQNQQQNNYRTNNNRNNQRTYLNLGQEPEDPIIIKSPNESETEESNEEKSEIETEESEDNSIMTL